MLLDFYDRFKTDVCRVGYVKCRNEYTIKDTKKSFYHICIEFRYCNKCKAGYERLSGQ